VATYREAIRLRRPLVRGALGTVACGHPLAASVGVETFRAGGGAVDAALATAAALMVLMPEACGLGGDAFILVRAPDGEITAVNGSGAAGAAVAPPLKPHGAAMAAVPGAVAAVCDAHARFGRLPLEQVLSPAIGLAGGGFPIGGGLLRMIADERELLDRGAPGWVFLRPELRPGSLVRQPVLAGLLQRIGRHGARAFYEGHCARALERAVGAAQGSLAASDLLEHATVVRRPLRGEYKGFDVAVQPPVSQAVLLLMALQALERSGAESPADRAHSGVEAIEAAFARKHELAADGAAERLLEQPLEVDPSAPAGRRGGPRGGLHTTSVAAAAADGQVVSMLVSVYDLFGCGVLVPECGFLLNDRLAGCSTDPDSPNSVAPGRRPVHTLSPALVSDSVRTFALTTPGADGQVQTLLQLIDAIASDGENLPRALDRPRWRSSEGRLGIESDYDPEVLSELERRGHELHRMAPGSPGFGAAVAAGIDSRTGTPFAASDPRGGAWAAAC
jgi:gamma-glutamyltranspeptidase / glutathione hydrolase